MNKFATLIFIVCILQLKAFGQGQVSNVSFGDAYEAYRDSLKNTPYPWRMPVMGSKIRKLGFDIPYPNGIMLNVAYSNQLLTLDDVNVGFDPNNMTNVDGLARFRSISSDVFATTIRYDFWLLPFLNFSAITGRINATTNVHLGLPFDLKFQTESEGTMVGWGAVIAGGFGPFVMSSDMTMGWTYVGNLSAPSRSIIAGIRIGHMIRFKERPDRNLVLLVGGQYLGLNPQSDGRADLEKLVGITPEGKEDALQQINAWYDNLSESEQDIFGDLYDGLSNWLGNGESTYIYYDFKKRLYYPWSINAGFNFQINKRYALTAMYSFLGSRTQIVGGLSYRFGWKGKNMLSGVTL
ncbi:hypothetical protein [Reichenbachiella ulvae]|uniref:Type IX secretion system membrane protein PorP/SprF n=1 Tax=Reichenbachiella ulvae TaxID=2980104 RepID=A0ABT3CRU5_9BACT|nr:hypothetical protein [Reichenbachiella ulvae]MCV9386296.1 hypothetical protein [Reichenbachiella ulvae]